MTEETSIAPVAPVVAGVETTASVPLAPTVEAPVVEAAVAPVEAPVTETVLGEALKPEEPKADPVTEAPVAEEPKVEEVKTAEGQSDEPAPPPVYEAFTLPEGFQPDEAQLKEFTDILSKLETDGKTTHEVVQKFGQEAVDFYTKQVQKAITDQAQNYTKYWEDQKTAWKDEFLKDPEMGGNRFQTTIDSALSFIRTHGGSPEQQADFRKLMDTSGLGNHPTMIRILANAGRAMSEGKPLAANSPVAPPKSRTETLYGPRKNYIS